MLRSCPTLLSLIIALTLASAAPSYAQSFPSEGFFDAVTCDGATADDSTTDETADHRNIVGDMTDGAYFYATDDTYLYLRMRVDADPRGVGGQGAFKNFGWSFGIDTDMNAANGYEVLVVLDGITEEVRIIDFVAPDPDFAYSTATHANAVIAPTTFNGTTDWFVTIAVPFADLNTVGASGQLIIWGGTSANGTGVDKDFACFDGTPGTISLVPVDPIVVPTACINSSECPAVEPVCDTSAGLCVQCVGSADCGGAEACVDNVCVPAGCGDGNVDGAESCDDGDTNDTNACSNSCKVNTGFGACSVASDCADADADCVGGVCVLQLGESLCTRDVDCEGSIGCGASGVCGATGAPCASNGQCVETCVAGFCAAPSGLGGSCDSADDADCAGPINCNALGVCGGNTAVCAMDGECVSNSCAAMVCVPAVLCGNGTVDAGESCDDGDNNDTNDCTNSCKINLGALGCTDDGDCAGDVGCGEGGACGGTTALCTANAQCVETCIGNACAPPAMVGEACDGGDDVDCVGAVGCSAGGQCGGDGAACAANLSCVNTCIDSLCAPLGSVGEACDASDASDCAANVACNAAGVCGGSGSVCTTNAQCAQTCIGRMCGAAASAGEACDAGDSDDCADGQAVCNQSVCQFPDGTGSCTAGNQTQVCISGMCAAGVCDGTCGDGTVDDGESCDAAGSNGAYPAMCSLRCHLNAGQPCAQTMECEEGLVCSTSSSCIIDSDGDGIADTDDGDDDNDGIADLVESDGNDPTQDSDGDGLLDFLDSDAAGFVDANNDGVDDRYDFDSDGIPNHLDLDSDDDTIFDLVEAGGEDQDNDGRVDGCVDINSNGTCDMLESVPLPLPNTDGVDGPDFLDSDDDDDGLLTFVEATDGRTHGVDVDDDGLPNWLDVDSDDDGRSDADEGRADDDGDGIPNYLDSDGLVAPDGGVPDGGVPDGSMTDGGAGDGAVTPGIPSPAGELTGGALGCAVGSLRGAGWFVSALIIGVALCRRRRRH